MPQKCLCHQKPWNYLTSQTLHVLQYLYVHTIKYMLAFTYLILLKCIYLLPDYDYKIDFESSLWLCINVCKCTYVCTGINVCNSTHVCTGINVCISVLLA